MSIDYPLENEPNLYVNGLQITYGGNTTATIAAGAARNSTNVNDIVADSALSLDASAVGANGLDTGSLGNATLYAVYVIGDSTAARSTACLASTSFTAPTLPYGYNMFRRIGALRTDGSAHFLQCWQVGAANSANRWMYYDAAISALSGGSATTMTAVALTNIVPAINTNVSLLTTYTPNGATDVAEFLPYGSSASSGCIKFGTGVAGAQVDSLIVPTGLNSSAPTILYKVTSGDTLSLSVSGYLDTL